MTVIVNGRPLSDEDCIMIYSSLKKQALDCYVKGFIAGDNLKKDMCNCQAQYHESLAKDFEQEAIIAVHD